MKGMELVAMAILGIALVLLLIRRIRKAREEKKPMELLGIVSLALAFVFIILRRFGA